VKTLSNSNLWRVVLWRFNGSCRLVSDISVSFTVWPDCSDLADLTNGVRGPDCKLQIHLIFSPSIYGPCAIRAGHESKEKTMRIRKLQYGPRRRGYQDICYISTVCLTGSGTILLTRNGFKFLTQVESKTGQFEIVLKSFARFNTQLKIKES